MTFAQTSLKITNYTVTALAVIAMIVALWTWLEAIVVWGDAYAFAEALTMTVVTLILFGVASGVEWLQKRGD